MFRVLFISHFFATYSDPVPPAWMTFEVMQMGQLSVLYEILGKSTTHKNIASYFGVTETVLVSWLHMPIVPNNNFSKKFRKLLRKYKVVNTDSMGFPKDWKKEKIL